MNKPPRIDQILSYFDYQSVQGQLALTLQNILRDLGYYSEIFVGSTAPHSRTYKVHSYTEFGQFYVPFGITIYHHLQNTTILDRMLAYELYRISVFHERIPYELLSDDYEDKILKKDIEQSIRYQEKLRILSHENWAINPTTFERLKRNSHKSPRLLWEEKNGSLLQIISGDIAPPLKNKDPLFNEERKTMIFDSDLIIANGQHLNIMLQALLKKHSKTKTRLILCGKGSKLYSKKLMQLCIDLDLSVASSLDEKYVARADVIFLNQPTHEQKLKLLQNSDAFISFADFIEDPRPYWDALNAHLPVFCSDQDQIKSFLGPHGILYLERADCPAYYEALSALFAKDDFRTHLMKDLETNYNRALHSELKTQMIRFITPTLESYSLMRGKFI